MNIVVVLLAEQYLGQRSSVNALWLTLEWAKGAARHYNMTAHCYNTNPTKYFCKLRLVISYSCRNNGQAVGT